MRISVKYTLSFNKYVYYCCCLLLLFFFMGKDIFGEWWSPISQIISCRMGQNINIFVNKIDYWLQNNLGIYRWSLRQVWLYFTFFNLIYHMQTSSGIGWQILECHFFVMTINTRTSGFTWICHWIKNQYVNSWTSVRLLPFHLSDG